MSGEEKRGVRKVREGVVVSDSMDKTLVVRVERRVRHRLYGKQTRRSSKLYAHDEKNEGQKGDTVRIVEMRPLSKLKRWRLVDVLNRPKMGAK